MRLRFKDFLAERDVTLQVHDDLNPKLWDGEALKPNVRQKLLAFGSAWAGFAKIPPNMIKDVLLVGGSASYNWTPFSDIDVHLLIDRNELGERKLVDDYLKLKKKVWTLTHHVTVEGYSLEPYAQSVDEKSPVGQGVFSLTRNEWVQKPVADTHDYTKDELWTKKVDHYEDLIDGLIKDQAPETEFAVLKRRIANMRKAGIAKGGEHSPENMAFKELRNRGALDRMSHYVLAQLDASLSV